MDFDVQANVAFDVKVESDWIKQAESRGLESHSLYFDVAENTGDDEREGNIVISSGDIEQVIKVIQRGKTVDVEKIAEYIVEVSEKVDPLFMGCETIEELTTHLDEIKSMEGVADAWVTNTALFVETEGGFPLSWLYTPDVDAEEMEVAVSAISESELVKSRTVSWDEHEYMEDFNKVCIINQQANDESRDFLKPQYQTLVANFKNAGFKVEAIDGDEMDVKFMKESLSSYDILFLITHGSYDGRGGHWILSGEEVWNKEFMTCMLLGNGLKGFGYATIKEIRDGKPEEVCYVTFSESFFTNSMSGIFNKSIIFNVACQSLKENNSLARAFISRGASVYVGYDESDNIGHEAGRLFYESMLQGMTIKEAGTNLPERYRINRWTDEKKGKEIVSNLKGFGSDTSIGNVCIVHPEPITIDATSINSATAILNGKIKKWVKTLKGEIGFCYSSTNQNPTKDGCKLIIVSTSDEMKENSDYEYRIGIEGLESETTYYYRAYININGQYIYGDVKSFTTTKEETTDVAEAVDLGLSVLWASHNVGATKPEEYGGYYAWGETEEKEMYTLLNYKYINGALSFEDIGENISGTKYDVAHVKWGDGWRMPTLEEMEELTSCRYERIDVNGIECLKFIGKNDNNIVLPQAGGKSNKFSIGEDGIYWSSTILKWNDWETEKECAYLLYDTGIGGEMRYHGLPVRPVKDK